MRKERRLAYFYIAFIGIQNLFSDFEDSFQSKNSTAIKVTPVLPPERISLAIATGVFEGEDAGLATKQPVSMFCWGDAVRLWGVLLK